MLILTAFATAAPQRVNTPAPETMRASRLALLSLQVSPQEIADAEATLGWKNGQPSWLVEDQRTT